MDFVIDRKEIYEKILEENSSVIYLADMNTYELVYLNRSLLRLLGRPIEDTSYIGQPCYKILQGLGAPCEFCNNKRLVSSQYISWEHYNSMLKRYFSIRDKKIFLAGRQIRLEIADDISQIVQENQRLQNDLSAEKSLMICIQNLTAAEAHDQSIHELLEKVCDLYGGERGYIFQFDEEKQLCSNTYEWCREGIESEIHLLQNVPLEMARPWIEVFKRGNRVSIENLRRDMDPDSQLYRMLELQGIESLVVVPLLKEEKIIGFIGVDNPANKPQDLSLMETIAQFVANDIEKRRILRDLEQSSNVDLLAKVFNRNRYIIDVKKLCREEMLPIGVIFLDLDNLKEINDTYGHNFGDELIKKTASILCAVFPDEVYRIGGDEFIVLNKGMPREAFENRVKQLRERFQADGVHISLGTNWRLGGKNLKEAILRADELMYQEKAGGRNTYGHSMLD